MHGEMCGEDMIKFGTGGWRAIIGEEFTKANVQLLTAAIAQKMKEEDRAANGFVIGYDRRFLSEEAAKWAAEVMAGEGILCRIISREAPTPLIMFTVAYYGLPYGMAVTASHNPAIYNGIKVFMKGGVMQTRFLQRNWKNISTVPIPPKSKLFLLIWELKMV